MDVGKEYNEREKRGEKEKEKVKEGTLRTEEKKG